MYIYTLNTMSADALLTWGARASAGMVLTKWPNKLEYSISGIRRVNSLIAVEYFAQTRPILHLLMPWQLMSPGYQQASHWPVRCAGFYHRCGSISTVCVSSVLKNNIKYKYFHFFKIIGHIKSSINLIFLMFFLYFVLARKGKYFFQAQYFCSCATHIYSDRYKISIRNKISIPRKNECVEWVNQDLRIDKQLAKLYILKSTTIVHLGQHWLS